MTSDKTTARIAGVLFLAAMVTSLTGGGILENILGAPAYLGEVHPQRVLVLIGVLLELSCALAVVGIAAALFPVLKRHNEALALSYVGFRLLESVAILGAGLCALLLIGASEALLDAGSPSAPHLHTSADLLLEARAHLLSLILVTFFSASAFVLYYVLYRTSLVPRYISVWGFLATAMLLTWNLLAIFGYDAGMLLALPIILNEIFLGIWLIARGFKSADEATGEVQ